MSGTIVSEVRERKKIWYRSERMYNTIWGGAGKARFPEAYEASAGLVLVERVEVTGAIGHLAYALTPPNPPAAKAKPVP